jgi:hypothetical protein
MIQPLRRRHFQVWLLLPLLIAGLFAAGLLVRRPTLSPNPNFSWETYK